jgi:hypothetical protein
MLLAMRLIYGKSEELDLALPRSFRVVLQTAPLAAAVSLDFVVALFGHVSGKHAATIVSGLAGARRR